MKPAQAALAGFLLVFAGFVAYQTAVDAGQIPPALGGFFTAGCAMALVLVAVPYTQEVFRTGWGRSYVGWAFAAFLALFAGTLWAHWGSAHPDILASHGAYLFKWVALFVVARLIDPASPRLARWVLVAGGITAAIVLSRATDADLLSAELARRINPDFQIDYQGIGHAVLVLALVCAATTRWRFAVYAVALPALFLSGARSELVAFLLGVAVIETCRFGLHPLYVLGALGVATMLWVALPDLDLPAHRVFNLLRLGEDESAIQRSWSTASALRTISDNPYSGAFASYRPGTYAHNILSAWVDLGLAGFALLVAVLVAPVVVLLRNFARCRLDRLYVLTLAMFAVTILLLVAAKTFTYQTVPLAVGLYCRWRYFAAPARFSHIRAPEYPRYPTPNSV